MLTRPDPIVLEVPATLHLLCSMDVSAWMSHCAEVSLCGRLSTRPPGLHPKLGLSFFFLGRGAVALRALPSVRVADVVSAVVRTGHTECSDPLRVALPVTPALRSTSFPSAVAG